MTFLISAFNQCALQPSCGFRARQESWRCQRYSSWRNAINCPSARCSGTACIRPHDQGQKQDDSYARGMPPAILCVWCSSTMRFLHDVMMFLAAWLMLPSRAPVSLASSYGVVLSWCSQSSACPFISHNYTSTHMGGQMLPFVTLYVLNGVHVQDCPLQRLPMNALARLAPLGKPEIDTKHTWCL